MMHLRNTWGACLKPPGFPQSKIPWTDLDPFWIFCRPVIQKRSVKWDTITEPKNVLYYYGSEFMAVSPSSDNTLDFTKIKATKSGPQGISVTFHTLLFHYRPRSEGDNALGSVCPSVCPSGCTQGTLYTTTPVFGLLVHQEGAICTTQAQYAPRCTRETIVWPRLCLVRQRAKKSHYQFEVFVCVSNSRADAVDRLLIAGIFINLTQLIQISQLIEPEHQYPYIMPFCIARD